MLLLIHSKVIVLSFTDDSEIVRIIMIAVAAILVGTGTVTATATGAVDVDAWWKQKKQSEPHH